MSKRDLQEKVELGLVGTGIAGCIFAVSCIYGCWGSRGIKTDYTTECIGTEGPAKVQHEDIRMGPDKYWLLLDHGDGDVWRTFGTIISADKKYEITVHHHGYSVKDYQPKR